MIKKYGSMNMYSLVTGTVQILDVLYHLKNNVLVVNFKLQSKPKTEYVCLHCLHIIPYPDYSDKYGEYQLFFEGNLRVILTDVVELSVLSSSLENYTPSVGVETA